MYWNVAPDALPESATIGAAGQFKLDHSLHISLQTVCLMSQSWDNVASMHDHQLTVHAHKT